jgi:uncharacterized protein (TIGR00369 family)
VNIETHQKINPALCGRAVALEKGASQVELTTIEQMGVDDSGLVHGGFVFGLADYAAMIAVNHPNVVLGGAEVRFLKPVRVGERLLAAARVETIEGKKRVVPITVEREGEKVFEGTFSCFVLEHHVLD